MIVDAACQALEESVAAKESTIKELLEDSREMEKKINSSFWAKIVPFINSHGGLLDERIVEHGVFDLHEAEDKMIENIKEKLTKRLRTALSEMEEEKKEEITKQVERYFPSKATHLMRMFEKQVSYTVLFIGSGGSRISRRRGRGPRGGGGRGLPRRLRFENFVDLPMIGVCRAPMNYTRPDFRNRQFEHR